MKLTREALAYVNMVLEGLDSLDAAMSPDPPGKDDNYYIKGSIDLFYGAQHLATIEWDEDTAEWVVL